MQHLVVDDGVAPRPAHGSSVEHPSTWVNRILYLATAFCPPATYTPHPHCLTSRISSCISFLSTFSGITKTIVLTGSAGGISSCISRAFLLQSRWYSGWFLRYSFTFTYRPLKYSGFASTHFRWLSLLRFALHFASLQLFWVFLTLGSGL
jgi:hypothetical protein